MAQNKGLKPIKLFYREPCLTDDDIVERANWNIFRAVDWDGHNFVPSAFLK